MAIASKDINFDYACADFYARIICVESVAKVCAGQPEKIVSITKELCDFVIEGAIEEFKRIVVATKASNR